MKQVTACKFIAIRGRNAIEALQGLQSALGEMSTKGREQGIEIELQSLLLHNVIEQRSSMDLQKDITSHQVFGGVLAVGVIKEVSYEDYDSPEMEIVKPDVGLEQDDREPE